MRNDKWSKTTVPICYLQADNPIIVCKAKKRETGEMTRTLVTHAVLVV